MKKGFAGIIVFIVFLLFMPLVFSATIHGKVFDYNFRLATNSIVKINTVPEQRIVAVDGSYSFMVPVGEYTITAFVNDEAEQLVYFVEDNISVVGEGDYVRDLILFPYEDLGELDLNGDFDEVIIEDEKGGSALLIIFYVLGGAVLIMALLVLVFGGKKGKKTASQGLADSENKYFLKKEKPEAQGVETVKTIGIGEEPDELDKVLAFIKAHKRVTQKDIRKEFPLSEAKISLIITDLESQGKVRKIKKGRGNIVIYNEK